MSLVRPNVRPEHTGIAHHVGIAIHGVGEAVLLSNILEETGAHSIPQERVENQKRVAMLAFNAECLGAETHMCLLNRLLELTLLRLDGAGAFSLSPTVLRSRIKSPEVSCGKSDEGVVSDIPRRGEDYFRWNVLMSYVGLKV